jgi:serpin B
VILANAIYFKGKWEYPFDKNQIKPRDFHLSDGGEKQVPMMRQSRNFSYQEGDGFQAVRLPYIGNRLQMYLFLPATNMNPQKLLKNLSGENRRDKLLPQFSSRNGTLVFPKFKLDYDILLNNSLKALGMKSAFVEGAADFSRMVDNDNLFITQVKQKSFVDVNEEGTEAVAVTTVMLSDHAILSRPRPFEMIMDRPFFFVIGDSQTQSVLFIGIVFDPMP